MCTQQSRGVFTTFKNLIFSYDNAYKNERPQTFLFTVTIHFYFEFLTGVFKGVRNET